MCTGGKNSDSKVDAKFENLNFPPTIKNIHLPPLFHHHLSGPLELTPTPVHHIKSKIKANTVLKSLLCNRSSVLQFWNGPWSIFSPAVAVHLLKRIADIPRGKAIVLTDPINIFPKSYMINFPLISKADTVMCKGEGRGFDDAKLSLWRYPIPCLQNFTVQQLESWKE